MELRQRSRSAISGENAGIADPVKKSTSTKQAKTKGIISGQTLSSPAAAVSNVEIESQPTARYVASPFI